jgi:uncharacterized membrane protein
MNPRTTWYRISILVAAVFAALIAYDLYSGQPRLALRDFALAVLALGLAIGTRRTS